MKLFAVILAVHLGGCAAIYTGATTVALVSTGKSIPEHAVSEITASDCSTWNYLFKDKDYLCEQRDIAKTYNRNGF